MTNWHESDTHRQVWKRDGGESMQKRDWATNVGPLWE
jgi:hypothetical protein